MPSTASYQSQTVSLCLRKNYMGWLSISQKFFCCDWDNLLSASCWLDMQSSITSFDRVTAYIIYNRPQPLFIILYKINKVRRLKLIQLGDRKYLVSLNYFIKFPKKSYLFIKKIGVTL